MYCDKCGKQLSLEAKFCAACGASIATPAQAVPSSVAVAQGPTSGSPLTWRTVGKHLAVGLGVYIVILVFRGLQLHGASKIGIIIVYSIAQGFILLLLFVPVFAVLLAFKRFQVARARGLLFFLELVFAAVMLRQVLHYRGF